MVTQLYIVRHGETEWNRQEKLQGWNDSDLTEKGRGCALLLGERLKEIPFDAIYSSSSKRALETAKIILGKRQEKIILEDDLREIYLGNWQGQTHEALKKKFPNEFAAFIHRLDHYEPITGESFSDVQSRVKRVIERIITEHPSGNVLIVTHSVCIEVLISIYKSVPLGNLGTVQPIPGTSLSIIESRKGQMLVKMVGDTQHLER